MKIISTCLIVLIALSAQAQHDSKMKFTPMITRSIGGSFQKFDGLNSRVAGLPQFKQLKDYTATIGLGWLKEKKNFISEGGVTAGSSMSGDKDERSSTIRYISVNANIGYDVLKSERVMLYPLVGLGYQRYQAIFYKDNSAVLFNDVLTSPTVQNNIRSVRFNNDFFVYRAGIGFSVRSPKHPTSSIGLQAGYVGSFKENDWKSNENQALGNAPRDKISQFFVSLVFTSAPWMHSR